MDDGPPYTVNQAEMLLKYVMVKIPGFLGAAENSLKLSNLWPEEDENVNDE